MGAGRYLGEWGQGRGHLPTCRLRDPARRLLERKDTVQADERTRSGDEGRVSQGSALRGAGSHVSPAPSTPTALSALLCYFSATNVNCL